MPSLKHQHQRRKRHSFHPPPSFWDQLPRLWLTKRALKEANRRDKPPTSSRNSPPSPRTFAPDFLHSCPATDLQEISNLSRRGGPDLSDIRNYPTPSHFRQYSIDPTSSSSKCPTDAETKPKSGSTAIYDWHFEQHLIDHGIYPPFYDHPDRTELSKPKNFDDIQARLQAPRPSLALSPASLAKTYDEFTKLNHNASEKHLVIKDILPILEGQPKDPYNTGAGHIFKSLAPLTNGTLAPANPDFYHGASPNQLNSEVLAHLSNEIIPSAQTDRPIAPNFHVEVKGHEGSFSALKRQALYDGALGARGMHSLQEFGDGRTGGYDDRAYTISSTYHSGAGVLGLYSMHPTQKIDKEKHLSPNPNNCTDYVTTQVGHFSLLGSPEMFRQRVAAYRNARDLSKEQKDGFIRQANERYGSGCRQDCATGGVDEAEY